MEISVQQVRISVQAISVMLIFLSSDNGKQIVFLHYTQHRLRIPVDSLSIKSYLYSPIPIRLPDFCLTGTDLLCQRQIPIRLLHPFHVIVISTPGYPEEPAHLADRIFLFMSIDYQVFYACSHFLPVSERKSRISSFSISSDLILASFRSMM